MFETAAPKNNMELNLCFHDILLVEVKVDFFMNFQEMSHKHLNSWICSVKDPRFDLFLKCSPLIMIMPK